MSKKIAVIGAGIMGLSTAYYLSKEGHSVEVFESGNKIGGMAAHFDFDGLDIERYYHFHCTSDYDYFELLKEFNLENRLHWVSTKMGFWFQNRLQPWGNPIALLKFKGISLGAKFRYGLHAFTCVKRNKYEDLDKLESTAWIKKWVGKEAWDKLWANLFSLKFYEYSTTLSAAWIWSRIRRIGRSRYNLIKEKLGYLEGGSRVLLESLSEYIKTHNGNVLVDSKVVAVQKLDKRYKVTLVDGSIKEYDAVISTIPLPYINDIFDFLPKNDAQKFSNVNNIGVVCVIVKLKQKLSENFWLNTNDPEMDIPGIIEYSNLNPCNGQHIVYVPYYQPIDNKKFTDSDEVYRHKIKDYFKKINPNLTDDDFIKIEVSRYTYAQPICGPEYLKTIPDIKISNEQIYIADTSYYYPEDRGISEGIKISKRIVKLVDENK